MKLRMDAVVVGKCYATKHGEQRTVISINQNGEITFDSKKKLPDGSWAQPRRFHANLENFAREAVSEIPCS